LDEVIKDYEKLLKTIKNLKAEQTDLRNEILDLKEQLRSAKTNIEIATRSERNITNVDLLKRISDLEKTIYGKETK
jgi:cell division septum initiation protein DivIVA